MNLYVLKQKETARKWDEVIGRAILAPSERRARILANEDTGDEGEIWEDEKLVSCTLVNLNIEQVVLTDFKNA